MTLATMPNIRFFVPGTAKPKARPRVTRGGAHTFTPDKAHYADAIRFALAEASQGKVIPMAPKGTPVYMSLSERRLTSDSWSKKKQQEFEGRLTGQVPDPVNIAMMFCDALTGIVYHDDCQVHLRTVECRWTSDPELEGVVCEITPALGEGARR